MRPHRLLPLLVLSALCAPTPAQDKTPRNIVFILSDDHRYDFMGFMDRAPEFLETPNLDRLAREGMHLRNAFVGTSLCSPSRASILTGQYMHHHKVVDNQRPVPAGTTFFPALLQQAGYRTGFIGKWHMGHDKDDPGRGSTTGRASKARASTSTPRSTRTACARSFTRATTPTCCRGWRWTEIKRQAGQDRPFFLYLSFKAVHYPFRPAKRHRGRYADKKIDYPHTMANTERNYRSQPRWVRERRYSIHGIDHMETGAFDKDPVPDFDALYRGYAETVHSLDENIGRVVDAGAGPGPGRRTR